MAKEQVYIRIMMATLIWVAGNGLLNAQDDKGKSEKDGTSDVLKVGDKAPDFELETFAEKTVKLSDRFGKKGKPVVLLFSRAYW